MPQKRFLNLIQGLSFEKKLVAAGSFLLAISLFLPWYQDLDTFHTGDTFSGISGPMYLAGLSFLIIASGNLLLLTINDLGIRLPMASLRSPRTYLYSGIFTFYLLILINSVYFHRNFGVNITMKQSGFGTFIAFIAAALMTVGGYLNTRQKKEIMKAFEEETNKPMIAPLLQQKPKENLRTMNTEQPKYQGTITRGNTGRIPQRELQHESQIGLQREPQTADSKKSGEHANSQPYRMDL